MMETTNLELWLQGSSRSADPRAVSYSFLGGDAKATGTASPLKLSTLIYRAERDV